MIQRELALPAPRPKARPAHTDPLWAHMWAEIKAHRREPSRRSLHAAWKAYMAWAASFWTVAA